MTNLSQKMGFTLVEIMIVMAIIGLLAGAFAFSGASARETARIGKATAESREILNAIRLYSLTNQEVADPIATLAIPTNGTPTDVTGSVLRDLIEPTNTNGNSVYFNAPATHKAGAPLRDPWGKPYRVRAKELNLAKADPAEFKVTIALPSPYKTVQQPGK